jgi:hypothetical protein
LSDYPTCQYLTNTDALMVESIPLSSLREQSMRLNVKTAHGCANGTTQLETLIVEIDRRSRLSLTTVAMKYNVSQARCVLCGNRSNANYL